MTDKKLIKRYIENNDQQAFGILFDKYKNQMKGFIMKYVKDPTKADDILQQTYLKMLSKIDDVYEERGKFSRWAFRIARNCCIDYIRKQKKFVDVEKSLTSDQVSYFDIMEANIVEPDEHYAIKDYHDRVLKCIENLPEEQREVLILRVKYEMKFKEIADQTNVSINTALGRMRYARINLEKDLKKYLDSESYKELKEEYSS